MYHHKLDNIFCKVNEHTIFVFLYKQLTAYEIRISDCSSDVCSSDLRAHRPPALRGDFAASRVPPYDADGSQGVVEVDFRRSLCGRAADQCHARACFPVVPRPPYLWAVAQGAGTPRPFATTPLSGGPVGPSPRSA